jgi:hypothetical protein
LLLIPLDDRPVNLDFPVLLASVAGEEMLTPPPAAVGHFLTPGSPETLLNWLEHAAEHARAAILALDMLAYGGLVASRTTTVTTAEALARLDSLRDIKARHPHLRLYAFTVIMRLTITESDAETRAAGRDIFRYSVLRDRVERLGELGAAAELATVTARIPASLLQAYLAARARNHAINRAALALLTDGILDFLVLAQEDTAPQGLHVTEQCALRALAREHCDAARWRIHPGTDEAAMTLLARSLLAEAGLPFPVALSFHDAAAAERPALFEDRPLRDVADHHLEAVGGQPAEDGLPCAVQTFTPPQRDLFTMTALPTPSWRAALDGFPDTGCDRWLASLPPGPLAVADAAYCNGGDPHLLDALLLGGRYLTLESYAGWNTAGNTLGTALAHAALRRLARARGVTPAMAAAHQRALLIRLLDDGLYQTVLRAAIMRRVEENGFSPLNLAQQTPHVEAWVNASLHALWGELRTHYSSLTALDAPFRAFLPWERLFEVHFTFPKCATKDSYVNSTTHTAHSR